ncbi:MAG: hypothetical protein ACEPOV_05595 [Hyphomicrobiales bacterium]
MNKKIQLKQFLLFTVLSIFIFACSKPKKKDIIEPEEPVAFRIGSIIETVSDNEGEYRYTQKFLFEYNTLGALLNERITREDISGTSTNERFVHKYNGSRVVGSDYFIEKAGATHSTHNFKITYTYDDNGKLIGRKYKCVEDESLNKFDEFVYNNNGELLKVVSYRNDKSSNDIIKLIELSEYKSKGNYGRYVHYSGNKDDINVNYKTTYDEKKNWLQYPLLIGYDSIANTSKNINSIVYYNDNDLLVERMRIVYDAYEHPKKVTSKLYKRGDKKGVTFRERIFDVIPIKGE